MEQESGCQPIQCNGEQTKRESEQTKREKSRILSRYFMSKNIKKKWCLVNCRRTNKVIQGWIDYKDSKNGLTI